MDKKTIADLEIKGFAREVIEFIDDSPTMYHVVKNTSIILDENGFERLEPNASWNLRSGGRYYLKKTNSTIIAFTIPNDFEITNGFKIFAGHTDSPSIRIKPNSEIVTNGILRLNTEVYGGPILSTWFDRPLSLAGRLILRSDNMFKPKTQMIKLDDIVLIIPNLAIHQNRDVNSGFKIDKQKYLLPILSVVNDNLQNDNYLLKTIAKKLNIDVNEILDFDLLLYPQEKGCLVGVNEDMMSCTKMDNLLSVYTGLIGLVESGNDSSKINIYVAFDNEEIGSSTKQGADSNYLANVLERIVIYLGYSRKQYLESLNNSFMLSCDTGHIAHPAFLEKSDITNQCRINNGVSIKLSVNQRYTSNGYSMAVIKQIAENSNIKLQYFVNNSNEIGGSTIGPLSARHLDIDSVDIGVPILSMHSIREMCGIYDVFAMKELAKEYFDN